jgi:hypothetical protein
MCCCVVFLGLSFDFDRCQKLGCFRGQGRDKGLNTVFKLLANGVFISELPKILWVHVLGAAGLPIEVDDRSVGRLKQPGMGFAWVIQGRNTGKRLDEYLLQQVFEICGVRDFGMHKRFDTGAVVQPDLFGFRGGPSLSCDVQSYDRGTEPSGCRLMKALS